MNIADQTTIVELAIESLEGRDLSKRLSSFARINHLDYEFVEKLTDSVRLVRLLYLLFIVFSSSFFEFDPTSCIVQQICMGVNQNGFKSLHDNWDIEVSTTK